MSRSDPHRARHLAARAERDRQAASPGQRAAPGGPSPGRAPFLPGFRPSLARRLAAAGIVLAIEAVFLAGIYALAMAYAPAPRLVFIDGLALPGAGAEIGGVIVAPEPLSGRGSFRGTRVTFLELGPAATPDAAGGAAAIGEGVVDANGVALLTLAAGQPGRRRFAARAGESSGSARAIATAAGILEVVPAEKPLLLVSLPPAPAVRSPGATGAESPGPEEALRALAAGRAIAYLADSPLEAEAARAGFGGAGLPEGPVLIAGKGGQPRPPAAVGALLKRLAAERGGAKHWAIARSRKEAADFVLAGIRAVVVGAEAAGKDGSLHLVGGWAEARRLIEKSS